MKKIAYVIACLFPLVSVAQTKLISHRSHSGSDAEFHTAIEHNLFDIGSSNFGIVTHTVEKIDTVVRESDNKIVVLKIRYETPVNDNKKHYATRFTRQVFDRETGAALFNANSADSLKAELRRIYKRAVTDSTLIIGFDKKFKQNKERRKK